MNHKISTYVLLTLFTIGIAVIVGAELQSGDLDQICDNDNHTLYRYNGTWMCGSLENIQINYTFNNITRLVNFWEDDGNDIFYDGGNVGIGTATPAQPLTVAGTVESSLSNAAGNPILKLRSIGAYAWRLLLDDATNKFGIARADTLDGTFVIDTNGKVGIGTTLPAEKLHVAETTAHKGALLGCSFVGNYANTNYAVFQHEDHQGSASDYSLIQTHTGATYLNSKAGQDTTFTIGNAAKMTLDSAGKIGIGTATPDHLLDVEGATSPAINVRDTTNNAETRLYSTDTFGQVGTTSNHNFRLLADGGVKMVIEPGGNIGIGTFLPTQDLEVSGNANITGNFYVGGCITYNMSGTPQTLGTCI